MEYKKIYVCNDCGLDTICDMDYVLKECPCCGSAFSCVDDVYYYDYEREE